MTKALSYIVVNLKVVVLGPVYFSIKWIGAAVGVVQNKSERPV
jgi:hypothetical protein